MSQNRTLVFLAVAGVEIINCEEVVPLLDVVLASSLFVFLLAEKSGWW